MRLLDQPVCCGCGSCTKRDIFYNTGCWDPWVYFFAMWLNLAEAIRRDRAID